MTAFVFGFVLGCASGAITLRILEIARQDIN
jgi:hypothetical protein